MLFLCCHDYLLNTLNDMQRMGKFMLIYMPNNLPAQLNLLMFEGQLRQIATSDISCRVYPKYILLWLILPWLVNWLLPPWLDIITEKMSYISNKTSFVCFISWRCIMCCVQFVKKCPYRVHSFFPDAKWGEISQWATDTPLKQANQRLSACYRLTSWAEQLSKKAHVGHEEMFSYSRYWLLLLIYEIKVCCWEKLTLVQGLLIFTWNLSPLVKKRERVRKNELSDSRVCVYFVLAACQSLHAWFPKGLKSVYCNMTRCLETYRETGKGVATCQQRQCKNQMEKLFLSP